MGKPTRTRDWGEPPPVNGARWLQLGNNKFALIDSTDAVWACRFEWHLVNERYAVRSALVRGRTKHFYLHHEVLGISPGAWHEDDVVTWASDDTLDCRRSNLIVKSDRQARNLDSVEALAVQKESVDKQESASKEDSAGEKDSGEKGSVGKNGCRITVRITEDDYASLEKEGRRADSSVGAVIRRLIRQRLPEPKHGP